MRTRKKKPQRSKAPGPGLHPYQRRWVEDDSRFKIACKARQIGFTFAAAWRVLDKRLEQLGLTVWLSASERQALEAMEHIRRFCRELRITAIYEESFIEGTEVKQRQVRLGNDSRIVALPANPDTVRGFAGDVVLDEFAFHRDAEAIWRAAFATATRGFQLEIISTPNGTRGKYYELARAAGLVDFSSGSVAARNALGRSLHSSSAFWAQADDEAKGFVAATRSVWSPHWVDLPTARTQGFVVDIESLRAAIGDEDAWQQEYCCRFLSEAAHYIPPELVVAAEHPAATTSLPRQLFDARLPAAGAARLDITSSATQQGFSERVAPRGVKGSGDPALLARSPGEQPRPTSETLAPEVLHTGTDSGGLSGPCYLGVDIGRRRDLTVLWLLEVENEFAPPDARRYSTRGVFVLDRQPFARQRQALDALLALRLPAEPEPRQDPFAKEISRAAALAVRRCAIDATGLGAMLAEELQTRWGQRVEPVTFTLAVKEDLAVRVKRLLEDRRLKIPYDPAVRAALGAVKRYVTPAGNVRFDADRTERAAHADHFWALALALLAADDSGPTTDFLSTHEPRAFSQAFVF